MTETEAGPETDRRQELLTAVEERVRRWERSGDRKALFSWDGYREVGDLVDAVGESVRRDHEVRRAAGLFFWYRHAAGRFWGGGRERRLGLQLLRTVWLCDPEGLAPEVRSRLRDAYRPAGGPVQWQEQAARLVYRYEETGEVDILRAAVLLLVHACEAMPQRHPQRLEYFSHTADQLERLHERTGEITMAAVLRRRRAVVAAVPDGDERRGAVLSVLARTLFSHAQTVGDAEAADEAIALLRQASTLLAEGDPHRSTSRSILAVSLLLRHRLRTDPAALAEAVELSRGLVRDAPPGPPDIVELRNLLRMLRQCEPDETSLRERAGILRRVLDATGPAEDAGELADLAEVLGDLFRLTGSPADGDRAREAAEAAVAATDADSAPGYRSRGILIRHCLDAENTAGASPHLNRGIALCRTLLTELSPAHPDRLYWLATLFEALRRLFLLTRSAAVLTEAARQARELHALALSQESARVSGRWLFVTAASVLVRYTDDRELVAEAIAAGREAAALTPPDDPDLLKHQADRAALVLHAHLRHGEPEALDEVVAGLRHVTRTPRPRDPQYTRCLTSLAQGLRALADSRDDPDALAEAADLLRAGLALPSVSRPETLHLVLLPLLRAWYDRTGRPELLAEAVASGRIAAASPEPSDDRGNMLSTLALALHDTFLRTRDEQVLDEAVHHARRAVAAEPEDDWHRSLVLSNLSFVLATRFQVTGDQEVLRESVTAARSSVRTTAAPVTPNAWSNLCTALTTWHQTTGDPAALDEAEAAGLQALAVGDPPLAAVWNNLAIVVHRRFATTGDLAQVRKAVQYGRSAVADTAPGHVDRPFYLTNLSDALRSLHEATGELAPLEESVATARQVIEESPPEDPWFVHHLSVFTRAALRFHQRTDDPVALRAAVETGRRALSLTPASDVTRPLLLTDLGLVLRRVATVTGDPATVEEAEELLRAAATACGPEVRPGALFNLASTVIDRYDATGDPAALEEAERAVAEALNHSETGARPDRWGLQMMRGRVLWERHRLEHDAAALTESLSAFRAAADTRSAETSLRLDAARRWGRHAQEAGRYEDALEAYEHAVRLLVELVPLSMEREDREHRLGRITGLAADAAAAALDAGRPERAVELLEQTRGVLMAEAVDARGDLARLRQHHGNHASAIDRLRVRAQALDSLSAAPVRFDQMTPNGPHGHDPHHRRQTGEQRLQLAAEWDTLLAEIRRLPGFERFLLPPTWAELREQAAEGPVVYVNATRGRCDALAVTRSGLCPIPLPGLEWTAIEREANRLVPAALAGAPVAQPLREILAWLWDTVTRPVLDALEAGGHLPAGADGGPPRLWWCPTGPMIWFPLHAAGHRPGAVLDRVVSSYTPTLRALASARLARREGRADGPGPRRTLVVSMPRTPQASPLPGVRRESARLRTLVPDARLLESPHAVRDTVLAALPEHDIAHFACHAVSDWSSPRESRLLLDDHESSPLTLAAVSRLRLRGDLAYLSACSTSGTAPDRVDEVLQLTSSFLLAGYAQVIGTLWPLQDAVAASMADAFYTDLTAGGSGPPAVARSARALHRAVVAERDARPDDPWLWAAHVHIGS
ncbi:hypothetical protein JCM4814A_46120 [Streptomyces phaeofaciens JCM 4814]|uniref:CHAT domain-containing protein n=1 Tax=Streptomyces phaeofaciens TaxID=68254 RepID=A0A918H107_9ACTN|nr:CHAT domain-containing protein [Streptomyces phaeofaciens]GGT30349.1 hypothetical protein GCM10010226_02800 [Streptomyces phaeofaciens]